jgi:hypothetical protein
MNARDVLEIVEPALADARQKVAPVLSFSLEQAKEAHSQAGPVTRVASGFAAGVVAGKLVSNIVR